MSSKFKAKHINTAFVRYAHPASVEPEGHHSAFYTQGTAYGEAHVEAFRHKRTSVIGATLPGKLMLDRPSLPRYVKGSLS